jgi:moderate conductance mechanosensitive channel
MGAAFALGSIAPFLTLDWNPVRREMYLGLLIAFVAIRVAADIGDFLLAPDHQRFRIIPADTVAARFWARRLTVFVGWFALLWVIIEQCGTLGFSFDGLQLVGYSLGLGLLAIALEAVWRRPIAPREVAEAPLVDTRCFGQGGRNAVLSMGIVLMWILWVAAPGVMSVEPGFWLVFIIIMLPPAIRGTRRAVEQLLRPPGSSQTDGPPTFIAVSLEHGIQALLIIGAVGVLARGWGVDLVHLAGQDTLFARIVHGVLSAVIILLVADVLWQAAKAAIDRKLAEAADLGQPNTTKRDGGLGYERFCRFSAIFCSSSSLPSL